MKKNFQILITAVMIACFITVGVQLARPGTTAQITTDQKMYSVGQTMNISGTGFTPGANIIITVQNPDHSTGSVSPYPVTDTTGAFKNAAYTPPLIPGRYTITATDGTNTAVIAVTEADAIGYNKGVYNKNAIAPEDATGAWTTGNAGKNYLENQWTFYQYQVTGVGSTIPDFDVVFNHFQAAKDAVFIDAFADFRACVDCTDSSFTTGNTPGMLLDSAPLPPSSTTNWVVADTAISHINRPLNSAADGSGSTVLTGSSGFCSSDNKEPIPDGVTTFPAEFHCFHVTGATLKSLLGSSVFSSGTHTVTLFYAAHLTASFVWGNGNAGVGGHEGSLGDCTSPYYAKGLIGPLASFEPLWPSGSGACTGLPKTYGTDDYTGWTSSLFGVGFASGSSRQFSLTNQSAGPSGAITLPIPTVAAPTNTIVIVKETVPSNATATFNYTSSQLGNFSLSNPFPSSKTFLDIAGGVEYDVNESTTPGWTLTNLNCAVTAGTDDGTGTWPTNSTNSTAAITLGSTDSSVTLTCTYTNTGTGHIIVNKHTNPAASPQSFAFTTTGTSYTGFSLTDGQSNTDGGTPPTGGLTPGSYSVTETAVAGWTLTNRTCAITTTGSGTSTFNANGATAASNITLGAGDTVTCDYYNSQPAGSITVAANGVNEVNHSHQFTITATQVPNGATAASTANITYAFTPSNPGTVTSTCGASVPFSGNVATCTVTVNNPTAGLFTINATAVFTVGGVQITKTTDGAGSDSGPATKRWVDAKIVLSPLTATNAVTQAHTITATVSQNDGLVAGAPGDAVTGFGPAPDGTLVTFSLLNNTAGATFVAGTTCTTTGGTCSIQINSTSPGGVDIHATTTFSVGGVSLTRASGDGLSGDSVNAHKNYVSGGITVTPTAVNEVGHAHIFTITATQTPGAATPASTANITYVLTPSQPGTVSSTCGPSVAFSGNNATCTVTINNTTAATFTINATAVFTVGGVTITQTTDGLGNDSGPATKTYVDASVAIGPSATNEINHAHVFTVTVTAIPSTATPVSFGTITPSVSPAPGTQSTTCGAPTINGNVATCTVTINSATAGTFTANVTAQVTMGGTTVTRSTSGNSGPGGSGPATKIYIAPATTLVTKSAPTSLETGALATIVVTETNTGSGPLTNVNVSGGGSCASFTPANVPTMAAGASQDFTCTFTVATGANGWFADGHGTDELGNPAPSTNEHTSGSVFGVSPATTLVTKSAPTSLETGALATIVVTETNTGNGTLTNVNVTGGGKCTSFSPASVTLISGNSQDFTCTFTVVSGANAWSADGHGTDSLGNPAPATNEHTEGTVNGVSASTLLTLKSAPTSVEAGSLVTIVVTEQNTGNGTLTNVNVTGGGKCTSFSPASVTLTSGASQDFTCTFTAAANANAWSADGHGTDSLGNPAPATGEHQEGSVRGVSPATTLTTKSAPASIEFGNLVTIVVTETNTGNGTLTNVNVTGGGSCASFSPASVTLLSGASQDFTCTFTAVLGSNGWFADGHGTDELGNPAPSTNEHTFGTVTGLGSYIIVNKISHSGTATFNFSTTGFDFPGGVDSLTTVAGALGTTAPSGGATTGPILVHTGEYAVGEPTQPPSWQLDASICTVDGTTPFGTPTVVGGVNVSWDFILPLNTTVTCTFDDSIVLQTTRTQGFWATHTGLSNTVWNGGTIPSGPVANPVINPADPSPVGSPDSYLCGVQITALAAPPAENVLMGGFWSNISKKSTGSKRLSIDQARMQMLQQYLAAVLNYHMFGSIGESVLQQARTDYCGSNAAAIQAEIGILGNLNQQGDSQPFTPGVSATAQASKSQADIDAWDTPIHPVD